MSAWFSPDLLYFWYGVSEVGEWEQVLPNTQKSQDEWRTLFNNRHMVEFPSIQKYDWVANNMLIFINHGLYSSNLSDCGFLSVMHSGTHWNTYIFWWATLQTKLVFLATIQFWDATGPKPTIWETLILSIIMKDQCEHQIPYCAFLSGEMDRLI